MLCNNGILSETSVPYMHQKNGHAERLNRMIMDKVQSMHFHACLTDTRWEFSWDHAIYVYNCTPISRLKWRTLLRHTQTTRVLAGLQEGIQEREREVYIDYSPHTLLEWRS